MKLRIEPEENALDHEMDFHLMDEDGLSVCVAIQYLESARHIIRCVNNHEKLVEALKLSTIGLEAMIEDGRCGDTFTATALHLDNCNALLTQIQADKGGE